MGRAGYVLVDGATPDELQQLLLDALGGRLSRGWLIGDGWQLDLSGDNRDDILIGVYASQQQLLFATTDRVFDELSARSRWSITADADPDDVYVKRYRLLS